MDGELDASNYQDLDTDGQGLYGEGVRTPGARPGGAGVHGDLRHRRPATRWPSSTAARRTHDPDAGWDASTPWADAGPGQRQEQLRLVAPQEAIDTVLDRTGMKQILPIFPDRSAALAG